MFRSVSVSPLKLDTASGAWRIDSSLLRAVTTISSCARDDEAEDWFEGSWAWAGAARSSGTDMAVAIPEPNLNLIPFICIDRKSVVSGKSVLGRVDHGGR